MDYNDDFGVALKDKRKAYEIDHETFSQAQVEMLMKQDIDHISGICGVDVSVTFTLAVLFDNTIDRPTPPRYCCAP
jgi:ariadne-1